MVPRWLPYATDAFYLFSSKPRCVVSDNRDKPSLTRQTVTGMAWVTIGVMVGRVTGFVAQFFLGWIVSEQDFGIYGIAISVSTIVLTLRTIGVQRILIQRGSEYDDLARPLSRMALIINCTGGGLLALAAPFVARIYGSELRGLLWIIACALPLSVPTQIFRAKLSIDGRFKSLVAFDTFSNVMRQTAIVVFALAGLGPLSFVLPLPIFAIVDGFVLLGITGSWPRGKKLNGALWNEFWTASKWVLVCGASSTFIVQGNTLVLGAHESKVTTGEFVFGFNLMMALAAFFNTGVSSVLMPMMSQLADDPVRHRKAHLKALRFLTTFASPICVFGALIAGSMIHFLWQGKWDQSAMVAQLFILVMPVHLLSFVGGVALESKGEWRFNARLHIANGVGTILSAWVGMQFGGLQAITLAAASYRILFGIFHCLFVGRFLGHSLRELAHTGLAPYLLCIFVGGLTWRIANQVDGSAEILPLWPMLCVYLPTIVTVYATVFRARLAELRSLYQDARNK